MNIDYLLSIIVREVQQLQYILVRVLNRLTMARELVISFLYGEFTAAMVDGARVIERWSPSASDRAHGFHEAAFRYFLESAVEHFDCAGEEAVLVVGDVEMEHHQVSLPPVNKQQRQQLLKIESAKLAEGRSLTWSHLRIGTSPVSSGAEKGFDLYLLHCWPQIKLNGYLADFAHAGVTPRLIIPDVTLFHAWAMEAETGVGLLCTGEHHGKWHHRHADGSGDPEIICAPPVTGNWP